LPYEPEEQFEIVGIYGVVFIMIIVYIVLAVVFVALLIIWPKLNCAYFFVYCDVYI
jgi:uncharacterized membrane protein